MLIINIFKDKDKGIEKVIDIIKSKVENQEGTFTADILDNKSKKVWYLDTKNNELYKKNGLLTRVKLNQDKSKYNVEFKIRNSDRSIASSYDLSNPEKSHHNKYQFKKEKYKFEEDITTPFNSIFSESAEFKYDDISNLEKYKDIESIYPSLNLNVSDKKEDLVKVNDFKAIEYNPALGKIEFANGNSAQIQLSIWYLKNNMNLPGIVELDLDVEAEKPTSENNNSAFDEFPKSNIEEINKLYSTLQDKGIGIVDMETSKTKTQFVYNYSK